VGQFELDKDARYGFSTRLLSWDASLKLVAKQPIGGYGVAHAQEQLDNEYQRLDYAYPLKEHLNAHNQFLQFWIESGIAGFALWALVFILLFLKTTPFLPANRYLIYSFILILFINSLFESVLNRFSGISFISFALCFIFSMSKDET
jgi:O-antigen ligase